MATFLATYDCHYRHDARSNGSKIFVAKVVAPAKSD